MAIYNIHAMQKEHKHLLRRAREINFQIRRDPRLQQEIEAFRQRLWNMVRHMEGERDAIVHLPVGKFSAAHGKVLHRLNKGLSRLSNVAEEWITKLAA